MVLDAVIFDLGGTILHLNSGMKELIGSCHLSLTNYLKSKGLNVSYDRVFEVGEEVYNAYALFAEKSLIELDSTRIYPVILYRLGIDEYDNEDLVLGAIESFYRPFVDNFCLFDNAKKVLSRLRERNLKIGLVSNNHSRDFHRHLQPCKGPELAASKRTRFDLVFFSWADCGLRRERQPACRPMAASCLARTPGRHVRHLFSCGSGAGFHPGGSLVSFTFRGDSRMRHDPAGNIRFFYPGPPG